MKVEVTPHQVHLFFCVNTREDGSPSCGHSPDTRVLAERLKARFKSLGLPVRITRTACLGPCAQGPNIMAYPQRLWFKRVEEADEEALVKAVTEMVEKG